MGELNQSKFKFCPLCGYALCRRKIDGRQRLACQKCDWIYYKNPLPVVICAIRNKNNEILIAKRNLAPCKNAWALPGGFIESNETPESACLRELKEETGLKGKIERVVGVYLHKSKHYGSFLIIGYEVSITQDKLSLNSELKDAAFFSKKNLPVIPFSSHRKIIERVF